jgi:hypothetical protein
VTTLSVLNIERTAQNKEETRILGLLQGLAGEEFIATLCRLPWRLI